MQNSGTKLVLALVGVALVLGVVSWWYRYEAAHRASQFWGPVAARLIAESTGLECITTLPGEPDVHTDLSHARGQAHLRHALMSDGNYDWDNPQLPLLAAWKWKLRFFEGQQEAWALLSDDMGTIGKLDPVNNSITAYSCAPMTGSLRQYFAALGLVAKPPAAGASGSGE